MKVKTMQIKKKESKRKGIQKLIFQRTIAVIKGSMMMNLLVRKLMA